MSGRAGTRPLVYWDSCVFLSFLSDEEVDNAAASGMSDWVERADSGEAVIITSTLAIVEVMQARIPVKVRNGFQKLFNSPHYRRIAPGNRICSLAAEIRRHYEVNKAVNGKHLSTPDAIHLATCILWGASEFHTFDGSGDEKTFLKKASLPLIPLSGNVAGHQLTVCPPRTDQFRIPRAS